jgi:ankyrin repeat protein
MDRCREGSTVRQNNLAFAYILPILLLSARCAAGDETVAPRLPPDPCSITRIVDEKSPPDTKDDAGATRLHCAANVGDVSGVRQLLAAGATVDVRNVHGTTPLMLAAQQGRLEVVKALLDAGARLDRRDGFGGTALLHCAAFTGNVPTLDLLLRRGADINAVEQEGKNALMLSIEAKHAEAALLLVERGASCDQRDRGGLTAIGLIESMRPASDAERFQSVLEACRKAR